MTCQTHDTSRRESHCGNSATRRSCQRLLTAVGFFLVSVSPLQAVTHRCGTLQQDEPWLAADGPYVLDCTVVVPSGVTLMIQPLAVVKAAPSVSLLVQGTLKADGAGGAIQFTSLKDDTVGGDTNGDGSASSPAAGDWDAITFDSPSTGNLLNNVEVRYGGSGSTGNLYALTSSLTISNSKVSSGRAAGIYVAGRAAPTISGNMITGNIGEAIVLNADSTEIGRAAGRE